jgi:hypothetical protein
MAPESSANSTPIPANGIDKPFTLV